ncbi:ABC transporter substrate-binding protein [Halosimplex amylolyticum]|uniref:ABC transporter substrate-binding protein n=1 Tax=Halosimplex amylolyticum TaxID=3396616 RepID=UPI003F54AD2F
MEPDRSSGSTRRAVLASALGVATAGCRLPGSDRETPTQADTTSTPAQATAEGTTPGEWDRPLEVVHGWYDDILERGPAALASAFENAHPDVPFSVDVAADTASERYDRYLERRFQNEDPPGSFATTPGATLDRFGYVLEDCEESVWTAADLRTHVEPDVRRTCVIDDQWVAVPISAHRVNTLFYNPSVLDAAGVDASSLAGVDDLLGAFRRVQAETDATPLGHAGMYPWTTFQFLETLLANRGTHDDVRLGEGSVADVRAALETAKPMLTDYADPDGDTHGYREAAERLAAGRAAFVQQGSWLARHLESNGHAYGEDWDAVPFPGGSETFLVSLSAFAYPAWNPTPTKTEQWLRVVGSEAGQLAFNEPLWSAPVREDCSTDRLGPFQTDLYEQLRDDRTGFALSMAHGVGLRRDRVADVHGALRDHFSGSTYAVSEAAIEVYAAIR